MSADGHVDIDTLADEAAGLTEPETTRRVADHLTHCADCRARAAALEDVTAGLRALPRPSMPGPVADRIDAALRTASGSTQTVVPLAAPDRSRRSVRLAGLAAAAAGIALVGALIASHVVGGGTEGGSGASASSAANHAAGSAAAGPSHAQIQALQGRETTQLPGYSASDLVRRLSGELNSASTSAVPSATNPRRPQPLSHDRVSKSNDSAAGQYAPPKASAAPIRALAPLRSPSRMFSCIRQLSDSSAVTIPAAVQFTTYKGKPAVIVVLPNPSEPSQQTAFVAGPKCGAPDAVSADLIMYVGLSH